MSQRMPALFMGHGSPMNAIEDTEFSRAWAEAAASLPRPEAVLCVSAHWETEGAAVTAMEMPRTIHDFYGFPPELFAVRYPAPGSPKLVSAVRSAVSGAKIALDQEWGLDHGTWSVLRRMYPQADVPVVQLSLDRSREMRFHFEVGRQLAPLRDQGYLLVGSGNIVHNLRVVDFSAVGGYDWAVEFDERVASLIVAEDYDPLVDYQKLGKPAFLSVNSAEHYKPLLSILGMRERGEAVSFFAEGMLAGSLSMRCVRVG
jgi:4,5-DOPA dioxygenase extradiol